MTVVTWKVVTTLWKLAAPFFGNLSADSSGQRSIALNHALMFTMLMFTRCFLSG